MLHPQVQRYIAKQKVFGYKMRSKDIICMHGASLIIYGLTIPANANVSGILEDISSKLSVFFPMIGTTKNSLGLDFIRLQTTSWAGNPTAIPADGYVDFSANTNIIKQYLKTGFMPPANQIDYHLAYYTNTSTPPSSPVTQVDICGSIGTGLLFGIYSPAGALGNLYNNSDAYCMMLNPASGIPVPLDNGFIVSRLDPSFENFYYAIDDLAVFQPEESSSSPVINALVHFTPGPLLIGIGPTGFGVSTKNCEGASAGRGLTKNQAQLLLSAFYYTHVNK